MSGLRRVQFYDNDTLLWSNNSSYSPSSSQFVVAIFSQGISIIDYIAHTAVSIFCSTYSLRLLFIAATSAICKRTAFSR